MKKSKKILIVDDEKDVLLLLGKRLTAEGYDIITAEDGQSAIEQAKKERPGLIILDLALPDMLGGQVADILKQDSDTSNTPVIFLSAMFSKGEENKSGHKVNGHFMFAKPWEQDSLVKAINRLIGEQIPSQTSETSLSGNSAKILLVDDDVDILKTIGLRLKKSGYEVVYASDGVSAISTAISEQPDIVILDLCIPAGNGSVILQRIQNNASIAVIPVIVMSGKDKDGVKNELINKGASGFISKPIDSAKLIKMIEQVLNPVEIGIN